MTQLAFVFPGQGAQSVGMLDAWGDHPVVKQTLQQASDALGEDLGRLIHEGPADTLALTTNTQPVMLVAGIVAYRMWLHEGGPQPQMAAGHSLGEYSALVAAGALAFEEAVPLVRFRAQAMQEAVAVGVGAMAAVLGLPSEQVADLCRQHTQPQAVVEAVNFNDPMQTVIAGHQAGVDAAAVALKAAGAKRVLPLSVSAPFHSSLMKPAAERLRERLQTVRLAKPQFAVINNIDAVVLDDPEAIREALYRQAFGPVRWVDGMRAMVQRGVTQLIECGPGKVLTGMAKRILPDVPAHAVFDPATLAQAKAALMGGTQP
ncbi:MAG: S-malonyltransferase [Pseudomonadota bacterium]|jgi:[acyl-carrier-protein] S-malonyltransferase